MIETEPKIINRHIWEEYREQSRLNRLSAYGKAIYARRKETVERSFADSKQLHGHRYAKLRGLRKVQEQCLLCAWTSNIKKIAIALSRRTGGPKNTAPGGAVPAICRIIQLILGYFANIFSINVTQPT